MSIKQNSIEVLKANDEKKLVYGVVLKPDFEDAHGDIMTAEEIEKSAHEYLIYYRNIGEMHMKQAEATVVESYLMPADAMFGDNLVRKGTWVVAIKVFDELLWKRIKDGDYKGLSAGGYARREKITDEKK